MVNLKHRMKFKCDGKQFQSVVCKKLFNNYSVTTDHKRFHFGERPFNCVDCRERFSCTSSLKSHYKWHKQQSLYFYKNDGSVRNLSSYEASVEQNSYKWNNHQQFYYSC